MAQRFADLEKQINGDTPTLSDAQIRKQHEHDLAEIQKIGLVNRAQYDFALRHRNATVESRTIGYFMDTNTVWCDVRYRLPGGGETMLQEFGCTRKDGTNWTLIWEPDSNSPKSL